MNSGNGQLDASIEYGFKSHPSFLDILKDKARCDIILSTMTYACDIETFTSVLEDLNRYGQAGYGRLGLRQVEDKLLPSTQPQGFQVDDLVQEVCAQFFSDNREHLTTIHSPDPFQTMQFIRVGCRTNKKAEAIFSELMQPVQTMLSDTARTLEECQALKKEAQEELSAARQRIKTMLDDAKVAYDKVVSDAEKDVAHLRGQVLLPLHQAPLHSLRKATESHDLKIRCKGGTLLPTHSLLFKSVPYFDVEWEGVKRSTIDLTNFDEEVVSMLIDYQYGLLATQPRRMLHVVQLGLLALYVGHTPLIESTPGWVAGVNKPALADLSAIYLNESLPQSPLAKAIAPLILGKLNEDSLLIPLAETDSTAIPYQNLITLLAISDPFDWDPHPICRMVALIKKSSISDKKKEMIARNVIANLPKDSVRLAARITQSIRKKEESPFLDQVECLITIRCFEDGERRFENDWLGKLAWKHIKKLSFTSLERIHLQVANLVPLSSEDIHVLHKARDAKEMLAFEVLCHLALNGIGVKKDIEQAKKYAREGDALGDENCTSLLGWIAHLNSEDAEARDLYERAHKSSSRLAAWNRYLLIPDDNLEEKQKWLERGADMDCASCQALLGVLLVKQDAHEKGLRWLETAAKQGDKKALTSIYKYYHPRYVFGPTAAKDRHRAKKLLRLKNHIQH